MKKTKPRALNTRAKKDGRRALAVASCSAIAPPPHVANKAPWIQDAAADILKTGFNPAFLYEEMGDVVAKHSAPLEAKCRVAVLALEKIVAFHCNARAVASAALKQCVLLNTEASERGPKPTK